MARKINSLKLLHRHLLLTMLLVFFLTGALAVAVNSHNKQKAVIIPSSGSAIAQPSRVKSSAPASSGTGPTDTSSPKTTTSSGGTASADGGPNAPSGTFVSTHQPSSSDTEESFCNTSAGATCYIQFTYGNAIKKLESKIAGSDGSVHWIWQVSDAGLSAGSSWHITAISSLNGQTKSTTDGNLLEVAP